jgi:hypothetical protein
VSSAPETCSEDCRDRSLRHIRQRLGEGRRARPAATPAPVTDDRRVVLLQGHVDAAPASRQVSTKRPAVVGRAGQPGAQALPPVRVRTSGRSAAQAPHQPSPWATSTILAFFTGSPAVAGTTRDCSRHRRRCTEPQPWGQDGRTARAPSATWSLKHWPQRPRRLARRHPTGDASTGRKARTCSGGAASRRRAAPWRCAPVRSCRSRRSAPQVSSSAAPSPSAARAGRPSWAPSATGRQPSRGRVRGADRPGRAGCAWSDRHVRRAAGRALHAATRRRSPAGRRSGTTSCRAPRPQPPGLPSTSTASPTPRASSSSSPRQPSRPWLPRCAGRLAARRRSPTRRCLLRPHQSPSRRSHR